MASSSKKGSIRTVSRQAAQRRSGRLLEFKTPGASALGDLARSGLSASDAARLRIKALDGRQYSVRNCAHFYFTSNHSDPLFIDASEQRYFIHDSRASKLDRQQITSIIKWREQSIKFERGIEKQ